MNPFARLFGILIFLVFVQTEVSAQTIKPLFSFDNSQDTSRWQIVNDGVMGGRSSSQAAFTTDNKMRFSGNLSLANNGGFASVRSRPSGGSLGLNSGDKIALRVKGDGRTYTFNLYTPDRRMAFSYQMKFTTVAGQWTEVRLPVDEFIAHSFGRPIRNMKLAPSQVRSLGILLGDKKPGRFEILVDSIAIE